MNTDLLWLRFQRRYSHLQNGNWDQHRLSATFLQTLETHETTSRHRPTVISRGSRTFLYVRRLSATPRPTPAGRPGHPYFCSTWLEKHPYCRGVQPTHPFQDCFPKARLPSSLPCTRWLCPMPFFHCRFCLLDLSVRLQATCGLNPVHTALRFGNIRLPPHIPLFFAPASHLCRTCLQGFLSSSFQPTAIPGLHPTCDK